MPWSKPIRLHARRHLHAATLMADGRVLLTGGCIESVPPEAMRPRGLEPLQHSIPDAEVVDPIEETSRAVRPMRRARQGHAALPLRDGRVWVLGGAKTTPRALEEGAANQPLGSTEVWDPERDSWTDASWLDPRRMKASMTLLRDGHVLVAGGWYTRTKERRGCSMGTPEGWRPTGQLNGDREAHGAVALRDGRVIVVAGQGPEGRARGNPDDELDSVEIWDPRSERWTVAAPLRLARVNPTVLLLTDGRVMVLAGSNSIDPDSHIVEVFDPRENRWSQTAPLVYPREMGTGVVLRDGRVFVAGCGGQGEGECRAEVWDPHTGEWSCVEGAMSEPRYWHTMTALPDGGVLIAGGTWDTDESSRFAQVWRP